MHRTLIASCCLLAPLAASTSAQATPALLDTGATLEARSHHVRATLRAGGIDVASGDSAASLSYAFETVSFDDAPFFQVGQAVQPLPSDRSPLRGEYRHGSGILERYDVRGEGIEQSFVFSELPPVTGDLVVRGRLTTELSLVSEDRTSGLVFENGLSIGGVTGIDAEGRTATGWIRLDGDELVLGLPEAFVSQASLPLVLDPVLGSLIGPIVGTDFAEGDVDIVYADQLYLVAWVDREVINPTTDWYSIRAIWINRNGGTVTAPFSVWTNQAGVVYDVSVGSVNTPNGWRYTVAFSRLNGITRDVNVRVFAPLQVTVGPNLEVATSILFEGNPDISQGSEDTFTLVWEVFGIRLEGAELGINSAGTKAVVLDTFVLSTNGDDRIPTIARCGNTKLAVWWRDNSGTVLENIVARAWNGTSPTGADAEFLVATNSLGMTSVDVAAAAEDDFFVVYDYGLLSSGADLDVYGRRITFPAGLDQPMVSPRITLANNNSWDEHDAHLQFTGNAYQLSFRRQIAGSDVVTTTTMDPMTGQILESPYNIGLAGTIGGHAVAAFDKDDPNSSAAMCTFTDSRMFCQRVSSVSGSIDNLDVGCPEGGELRVSTLASPNPGFRVELWDAFLQSGAYLAVADAPLFLQVGGAQIVFDPLVTASYFAGSTSDEGYIGLDLPVPAGLSGNSAWLQWLTLSPGATCTGFPVTLSNGMQIKLQ